MLMASKSHKLLPIIDKLFKKHEWHRKSLIQKYTYIMGSDKSESAWTSSHKSILSLGIKFIATCLIVHSTTE